MSPDDLAALLAEDRHVRIVMPVHCYGVPCRANEIQNVIDRSSRKHGRRIEIVYDAAHAFGATVESRRVGTSGKAEVFSLSAVKVLTSVEGGLVVSRDQELLRRVRAARNYGFTRGYEAQHLGLDGKMSELHAIIGLASLASLDERLAARCQRAERYAAAIRERTTFRVASPTSGEVRTNALFTVIVPTEIAAHRDQVVALLAQRGIETRTYFHPPLHHQTLFRPYGGRPLPNTDRLAARVLNIPFYTAMTDAEMERVVDALHEAEMHLGAEARCLRGS